MKYLKMGYPWDLLLNFPGMVDSQFVPLFRRRILSQQPDATLVEPPQSVRDVFQLRSVPGGGGGGGGGGARPQGEKMRRECSISREHCNPIGGLHGGAACMLAELAVLENAPNPRAIKKISTRFVGSITHGQDAQVVVTPKPRVFDGTMGGKAEVAVQRAKDGEGMVLCDLAWAESPGSKL